MCRPGLLQGGAAATGGDDAELGRADIAAVYLPTLWPPSCCWPDPLALAYADGHFVALAGCCERPHTDALLLPAAQPARGSTTWQRLRIAPLCGAAVLAEYADVVWVEPPAGATLRTEPRIPALRQRGGGAVALAQEGRLSTAARDYMALLGAVLLRPSGAADCGAMARSSDAQLS